VTKEETGRFVAETEEAKSMLDDPAMAYLDRTERAMLMTHTVTWRKLDRIEQMLLKGAK
jgi:hypothetical protein